MTAPPAFASVESKRVRSTGGHVLILRGGFLVAANRVLAVMNHKVVTNALPDHLYLNVSGEFSPQSIAELIHYTRSEADKADRHKVLVDCRGLRVALSETDRFHGGLTIAEVFGGRFQVAVVMPKGQVTKMGELAAVNRGARLIVTDSMHEAEEWLRIHQP